MFGDLWDWLHQHVFSGGRYLATNFSMDIQANVSGEESKKNDV